MKSLTATRKITSSCSGPENVPLETEEAKLCQQYQKLSGSLTVQFRGEEKTLVQMGRYLEEPDRALAAGGVGTGGQRRLQEAEKFEEIFDQLVKLREQIAKNAGFENYRDYAFRKLGRFDYTPADCVNFHDAIEQEIMPVVRELQTERRRQLKLEKLRPWDLAVDPLNRPPLKPFEQVEKMVSRTQKIFDHLDGGLGGRFSADAGFAPARPRQSQGQGAGRLSIHARRSAAAVHFHERRRLAARRGNDFARGRPRVSRAGDARRGFAYAYRSAPIEFCEVASMSMELLGNEFIEEFYSAPDANRARREHLEGIVGIFPWIATVDAFQHWIYTHPGPHARRTRRAAWLALMDRFGGDVDWSGYEEGARESLASAAAHFPPSVLLRRIRHRATRRVASLGEFKTRQSESVERLQESAGAGRLAAAAGIICRRGLPV